MRLLADYLKNTWKRLALLGVCAAIFALVFSLYHLPAAAAGYGALLCLAFLGVVGTIDLCAFARRHRLLRETLEDSRVSIDRLPAAMGLIESDLQRIIRALYDDRQRIASGAEMEKAEMIEYYGLWVHQIKTPIAAMRLILQGEDTETSRELSAQLFKIERYVDMVLAYLRLGGGVSDLVIREYDLDGVVRQAVRRYAPLFIRKRLSLDLQPIETRVLTDEKWLCFAIEQILSNAVKYTAQGGVTIGLEGEVLFIRDTGMGIAAEDLPRVCECGFTGYNGRTDKKATGLGLYLCRRALSRLNHGLSIESEPGRGTTVRIDLSREKVRLE